MANVYRIALYPGDGIGPEVVDATRAVLDAVERRVGGFHLEYQRFDWGMAHYDRHGHVAPDDFLDDASRLRRDLSRRRRLAGAAAGSRHAGAAHPHAAGVRPLCVRAAGPHVSRRAPPASHRARRSIWSSCARTPKASTSTTAASLASGTPDEVAVQSAVHTRRGVERILRFSFELARTRRRRLTMITKSNAQRFAYVLWDRVLAELAPEYADVATEKLHIDAATLELVRRPHTFDVVVGSNLFGDILSDLTGGITGSLGLNPSANLDPTRRSPSLFEPVHGSAPDIAGRGHRESRPARSSARR